MKTSLVTQIVSLIALVVVFSFAAFGYIFHRSAKDAFVLTRDEEVHHRLNPPIDQFQGPIQDVYLAGGWDAVADFIEQSESRTVRIFVIDQQPDIVVSNDRSLYDTRVKKLGRYRFQIVSDPEMVRGSRRESELVVEGGTPILSREGHEVAQLFVVPTDISDEDGAEFAGKVWNLAGIWLAATLLLAIGSATWLLRRTLSPLRKVAEAASILERGEFPNPIPDQSTLEMQSVVSAVNSATTALKKTNEDRKRFVSDIAHDLRTPVTNIRALLEAAESGLLTDADKFAQSLSTETALLERLIGDFQQLMLSDMQQLSLTFVSLPLRELVESCLFAPMERAGAKLVINIHENLWVRVDEHRFQQVLSNLVDNAIRHHAKGLEVTVSGKQLGDRVQLTFADNGPGIASKEAPLVFDRFYRAENSRNRMTGGTGLGLAIAKSLTEAMGGRIELAPSEPGQGAVFKIDIQSGTQSMSNE